MALPSRNGGRAHPWSTITTSSAPARDGVAAAWLVTENRRVGTAAWQITGKQDATGIMGYADHVDAVKGVRLE
jgi:hypothetical protein